MKLNFSPRWLVLVLFIVFIVCCGLLILHWQRKELSVGRHNNKIRLVNILSRHGDRAPATSRLSKGDKHAQALQFFWPNGLTNLTDSGKLRQYKIGLELRRLYSKYIGYNSSQILALSSTSYRCIESLELTLRGLYDISWTAKEGIKSVLNPNCLPSGSGSGLEWRSVQINTTFLPSLFEDSSADCRYLKENPSPILTNLISSKDISALVGLDKLRQALWDRYDQPFDRVATYIWMDIISELQLARTTSSIEYADHYSDWINLVVSRRGDITINLLDLFEQVNVLTTRDSVAGLASRIQTGPILASIVESQMVALTGVALNERMQAYVGKKMILYSTHDVILENILHALKVIDVGGDSFEDRFYQWAYSGDQLGKLLAGLKMPSYGMSLKFELLEMEHESRPGDSFAHVQLSIYNQEDGKHLPIDYRLVALGDACQRLFYLKYPDADDDDLFDFYDSYFPIDRTFSCPFGLFQNVTSELTIDDEQKERLCADGERPNSESRDFF